MPDKTYFLEDSDDMATHRKVNLHDLVCILKEVHARAHTYRHRHTHTHTHVTHLYSAYKEFLCRIQFLSRSNKHVCLNTRTRTSTHTHAHSDLRDIFGVYACCTVSFIYARLHTSTHATFAYFVKRICTSA